MRDLRPASRRLAASCIASSLLATGAAVALTPSASASHSIRRPDGVSSRAGDAAGGAGGLQHHRPEAQARADSHLSRRAVVRIDEAKISRRYGACRVFSLSGCPFGRPAVTPNGHKGLLYAIVIDKTAGDSCGLGAVYFFNGTKLVGATGKLPPHAAVAFRSPVRAAGARRFIVRYALNRSKLSPCFEWGAAGGDPYTYSWNGRRMLLVAGKPPRPPLTLTP